MYVGVHVRCPLFLSDFIKTWTFWTDFRKILKYQISWTFFLWEQNFSCGQAERERERERARERHEDSNSLPAPFCEHA